MTTKDKRTQTLESNSGGITLVIFRDPKGNDSELKDLSEWLDSQAFGPIHDDLSWSAIESRWTALWKNGKGEVFMATYETDSAYVVKQSKDGSSYTVLLEMTLYDTKTSRHSDPQKPAKRIETFKQNIAVFLDRFDGIDLYEELDTVKEVYEEEENVEDGA